VLSIKVSGIDQNSFLFLLCLLCIGDRSRAETFLHNFGSSLSPDVEHLLVQIDKNVPIDLAITFDEDLHVGFL
jgi:hypothetical protein